ncbi:MAG: hypothetical protein HY645_11535 [Acidobacteria bacterium]|nr:hypothetical protein [Acidobacteriota bacterium]
MRDSQKATAADADLILKLYDLRRETEMRKARNFIAGFMPQNLEEFLKVMHAFGTPENAYLRQAVSYWEMAASLVLRGALHEGLFNDNSDEMYFIYAKFAPFLPQLRQALDAPQYMERIQKLVEGTPEGRQKLERVQQRISRMSRLRAVNR